MLYYFAVEHIYSLQVNMCIKLLDNSWVDSKKDDYLLHNLKRF